MLTYDMDQRGEESLYAYLYDCMRADIENGSIAAGEKLPSKRKLADHLGVSIVTVEGAYRQLIAEGYVESRARRGYFAAYISSSNTRALTKEGGVAPAGTFMPDAFEHKGENELVFSPSYAFDLSKGQLRGRRRYATRLRRSPHLRSLARATLWGAWRFARRYRDTSDRRVGS